MTKKKRRKTKKNHKSRHHILPNSRGGNSSDANIKVLNANEHQNYHTLFSNLTPDEIIVELVEHFWNGQIHWVYKALRRLNEL